LGAYGADTAALTAGYAFEGLTLTAFFGATILLFYLAVYFDFGASNRFYGILDAETSSYAFS